VKSAGKCLDKTDRNFGTRQEKTDRNVGNAHFFIPIFFTMTGRGRGGGSRGGRGGERGGCGRGRGQNYTGARMVAKSGLCAALGNNVFDYGCRHQGREFIANGALENGAFCTVFSENFHKF
jgi:hypothetical protein